MDHRTVLALALLAGRAPLSSQVITRNVPYRLHPSAEQYMDLYAPQAAASVPVALFIHGGSLAEAGERRDSSMYAPVCPGLAARGIHAVTLHKEG